MPLTITHNDITKMKVDAIVNAANINLLELHGGISGAILNALGVVKLCNSTTRVQTGDAIIAKGFDLPAKYIIHTAWPDFFDGNSGEEELLRLCYTNSLNLAIKQGFESIALPLISNGFYGYPKVDVFRIALASIEDESIRFRYMSLLERAIKCKNKRIMSPLNLNDYYPEEDALRVATDVIRDFVVEHDIDVSLVVSGSTALKVSKELDSDVAVYLLHKCRHLLYSLSPTSNENPAKFDRVLSKMELEILRFLSVYGLNNEQIAERLYLSNGTVKNYMSSIYEKTGIRNRAQLAARYALEYGQCETDIDLTKTGDTELSVYIDAKLRLVGLPGLPDTIPLKLQAKPFIIGRYDVSVGQKQCDFEFAKDTKAVSRRHASIERTDQGCVVTDLGSRAGTFVNDKRIAPNEQYLIEFGDRVSFGNAGVDYIFECETASINAEHQQTIPEKLAESVDSRETPIFRLPTIEEGSFVIKLLSLIKASGITDSEIRRRTNIDRRTFSRIKSNVNYAPKKSTVLAIANALELSLDQTNDLLKRAGYTPILRKLQKSGAAREKPVILSEIKLQEPFATKLLSLIDESGKKDSEIYRRANIDRRLFSKIRSDVNYMPKKPTVLAFAIALQLSLDQTNDLLKRAGFTLSHSRYFDVIVEFFIKRQEYDVFLINNVLFQYNQPLLGVTKDRQYIQ